MWKSSKIWIWTTFSPSKYVRILERAEKKCYSLAIFFKHLLFTPNSTLDSKHVYQHSIHIQKCTATVTKKYNYGKITQDLDNKRLFRSKSMYNWQSFSWVCPLDGSTPHSNLRKLIEYFFWWLGDLYMTHTIIHGVLHPFRHVPYNSVLVWLLSPHIFQPQKMIFSSFQFYFHSIL